MSARATDRTSRRGRLARRLAIPFLLAAFLLPATPGVAAAGTSGLVLPFVDCYVTHADGGYTFVFGYTSTYSTTKTFAHGNDDHVWPSRHQGEVPTTFEPGTHHGAWSITVTAKELGNDARWQVDGYTLSLQPLLQFIPVCAPGTEMPAAGNGAGGAIALGLAGVVGAVLLRRSTKRKPTDAPV